MGPSKFARTCHREMLLCGLSVNKLAENCGVSQASLSRWFRGKQGLSDELVEKVFKTLHLIVVRKCGP